MKGLTALVAGAVLSSSVYAAEPSLHTTPDSGYPLVQENADKALKVAYLTAGQICAGETFAMQFFGNYYAALHIEHDGQVYGSQIIDYKPSATERDTLIIFIYPRDVSLDGIKRGDRRNTGKVRKELEATMQRRTEIWDKGLDAHIDFGKKGMQSMPSPKKEMEWFEANRDYLQNQYMDALDKIIAACEGAKK